MKENVTQLKLDLAEIISQFSIALKICLLNEKYMFKWQVFLHFYRVCEKYILRTMHNATNNSFFLSHGCLYKGLYTLDIFVHNIAIKR